MRTTRTLLAFAFLLLATQAARAEPIMRVTLTAGYAQLTRGPVAISVAGPDFILSYTGISLWPFEPNIDTRTIGSGTFIHGGIAYENFSGNFAFDFNFPLNGHLSVYAHDDPRGLRGGSSTSSSRLRGRSSSWPALTSCASTSRPRLA